MTSIIGIEKLLHAANRCLLIIGTILMIRVIFAEAAETSNIQQGCYHMTVVINTTQV
jgi:hypothetical protein